MMYIIIQASFIILLATFSFGLAMLSIEPAHQSGQSHNLLGKSLDQVEASGEVQTALRQRTLLNDVEVLAVQFCQDLPHDLKTKCLEKSGAYINQTKSLLQDFYEETSLCSTTGLCIDDSKLATKSDLSQLMDQFPKVDKKNCTECQKSVRGIMTVVKEPRMKNKIIKSLVDYCEEEGEKDKTCKKQIYTYAVTIMAKLEKLKPIALCQMIGQCDPAFSL